MLLPQFAGPAGVVVAHPLDAAGPDPVVDLEGLARLFCTPVLFGEFAPSSYWRHVEPAWPAPEPDSGDGGRDLIDGFAAAVERCAGDADTVAVALSGGIDSLAVLWHVLRLGRRVLAFTVDLVDDTGTAAHAVVVDRLEALGVSGRVQLRRVDPHACMREPGWSPFGPRMDALPRVNATIAQLAADAGAEVLLSGNGADELLATPRYATAEVTARHGMRAGRQYLHDMAGAGYGRTGEFAAMAARSLPPAARVRAYAAVTWPHWCNPSVSPVLASPWHQPALSWARSWVRGVLDMHTESGRSWAQADAWDSWWPRAYLPPSGPIREASPFTDAGFAASVLARPLATRYDPAGRSAYLRVKGAIAGLFPPQVRALPSRKRYYAGALATAYAGPIAIPTAAAVGLLDPGALDATSDTATRMMAAAVEAWLTGAIDSGARIDPAAIVSAGPAGRYPQLMTKSGAFPARRFGG